jgi:MFS family permease
MLGQGVGPVFGGVLSQYLGYRSIFWFLTILAAISLFSIMCFLPETLRSIAGNGTVHLQGLHKPYIYYLTGQPDVNENAKPIGEKKQVTWKTVLAPLTFLGEKDVFITLFFGAIVYTVWSMVTSSTSQLFEETYGLNTLEVGLTFLGNGFGCMSGSYTIGYLMDYNHKRTERDYCQQNNLPLDTRITTKTHADFPIEYARMRNTWWITALFVVCTAVYGVSLRTHLAVPIILQYIIAYCATAIFTINSALIIDLYPGASASATAVNNLMRCLIGAGGVALVTPIIDAIGSLFCFVLLAGLTLAMVPLLMIEMRWGAGWRMKRNERLKAKAAEAIQEA